MFLSKLGKYHDFGLLILRIGLGFMFILHGEPKLFGGVEKWESVGKNMSNIGINFAPAFWGFLAGFTEFAGGICLVLGVFFRPACIFLFFVMIVAMTTKAPWEAGLLKAAHPIELGIVFLSLIFIGPGKYSIDKK